MPWPCLAATRCTTSPCWRPSSNQHGKASPFPFQPEDNSKEGTMSFSRRSLGFITAALLLSCAASSAGAQPASGYPNKLVRIIVPSPPGGPPDQIARIVATKLQIALGQTVIVENRAGAGGMVGTAYVAKTPPDGYTVLVTTASHTVIPSFTPNTPYDAVKDFTHVTLVAENFGQVLVVHPSLPVK